IACWYSGAAEASRDARILCADSGEGAVWSEPWTAVAAGAQPAGQHAEKSLGNVVLFEGRDGRLWMVHGAIQSPRMLGVAEPCPGWRCGRIDARWSADGGRTWSQATRLLGLPGALPRAKPLVVPGLGLVLPAYQEAPRRTVLAVVAERPGPSLEVTAAFPLRGVRLIQPALATDAAGGVRAFFRDPKKRAVWTAVFDPKAMAWSAPEQTNLPNPSSAVDVFRDRQGRYVLVYNPSQHGRGALALARSSDGVAFQRGCYLAEGDGDVAYPTVTGDADHGWAVIWSASDKRRIATAAFDEAWLAQCFAEPPASGAPTPN
ncbi:MAG TPA: exo-alpha-sialidase, partial [Caulobacteraceae bacterium]|nr:exo-alpha-sialidase [Caulobacteraceae bacterium]